MKRLDLVKGPGLVRRLAAGLAILSAACVAAAGGAGAQTLSKVTVQLALEPAGTTAALFLAEAKGWNREAGFEADIKDGRGSMASIQLVAAGQMDIGTGGLGAMAVAKGKGAPLISIAGLSRRTDLGVLVDANGPIRTVADLRGKRVLLFAASPWVPFLDSFLKNGGLTRNDLTIVFLDAGAFNAAYAAGQADAVMSIGPYVLPVIGDRRPSRVIDAAEYGVSSPGTGLYVREEMVQKSPELLGRFVKNQIRAWDHIFAGNADEAVAAIMKARPNAKLNPDILKGQIAAYRPYFDTPNTKGKPIGWQSEIDWKETIRSGEEAGLLKPGYKPADFFTNRFVE
ncbi:ABC transporter substrate-binding protein [Allostella humosa]|uniref:ABC transporter substrate-binding protein n=1 Tax=Stella humosa TaxID=94 RepID=UPI0014769A83|nr:ABC transporter substrate-binding protein [Stella humosa]